MSVCSRSTKITTNMYCTYRWATSTPSTPSTTHLRSDHQREIAGWFVGARTPWAGREDNRAEYMEWKRREVTGITDIREDTVKHGVA